MLHQNWFTNERFEMFNEYYETQWFYDTENKCFYIVSELDNGNVQITEHSGNDKNDMLYPQLMCEYEEWKQNQKRKNWKETECGVEYYVSPNTGWVYMFYDMKALDKKYSNTDMMCCMCEYYNEQGILESGCEDMEIMEIIGWQFAPDGIPYEDMENMIEKYEDRRV